MRLWSLHPRYLDSQGLTACWREGLLAQSVIGRSAGAYSRHPQLQRFRDCSDPLAALGEYLRGVVDEADARGYRFARDKIQRSGAVSPIPVTDGQVAYEWRRLSAKLQSRSPQWYERFASLLVAEVHPVFTVVPGAVESWEREAPLGLPGTVPDIVEH
jgi:hypothetical protein